MTGIGGPEGVDPSAGLSPMAELIILDEAREDAFRDGDLARSFQLAEAAQALGSRILNTEGLSSGGKN